MASAILPRPAGLAGARASRYRVRTLKPPDDSRAAVARLLDEHGGKIYGLGLRLCGSPQDAEDLVQETFLRALRKWHTFEGRGEPSSWLFTIAARVCRRRHRRRSGEPRRLESLDELLPSPLDPSVPDLPAADASPLDEQLRREVRETVEGALGRLPMALRLPVLLKEVADLSLAEIAQVLGLKEATVKTRVHRGRLALRRELDRRLPRRPAAPPDHSRSMCLDLLQAKQEALDRGVELPLAPDELCSRCRSLFATLDLARDACRQLRAGELPASVRALLGRRLEQAAPASRSRQAAATPTALPRPA
jgi:RNA polymerase sigma-70 factor, ECF subfamily